MPGRIKVKVVAGRNLPVMDRASDTTDAFVEIKFGSVTHKTDVCRKSLNPHWSTTEWYRFEVDESELQDEPLQLRLMDHDTYSANDAIGKVVISLAPLIAREASKGIAAPPGGAVMSGWIPVFDTMHGIRGELNVVVKVELFSDFNKYKTSSCGVQFFHCPMIPPGFRATAVHGFVEELVVNDDPEYQWIDKIRTPRASNEARQVAFIKLSNQVQRLVGLKATELGANAVIGYQQDFDLEGEAGVVARAIGTAVTIVALPMPCQPINIPPCTQQQLKKYLDILATDGESITDLNQYFQNHQDELQKLLTILHPNTPGILDESENADDEEKMGLARASSIKSYTGSVSIYQDNYISQKSLKHISDDQTDLNKLLKRTDGDDSDSDSSGPLQTIKKIKKSLFPRNFGSIRSRRADRQDDTISCQSNSSDSSRMSLTDVKNEFKRFKKLKRPQLRKKFAENEGEGIGMASILARSVIHAHTSLSCIAETHDSEHSPTSTTRRTSESEPTINLSDEDKITAVSTDTTVNPELKKVPEIHTSLTNINCDENVTEGRRRKLSESCPASPMVARNECLLLPGQIGYFGSVTTSGDSSEVYSSSEEDDESSDPKSESEIAEKCIETPSSIAQTVLNLEDTLFSSSAKMNKDYLTLTTSEIKQHGMVSEETGRKQKRDDSESKSSISSKCETSEKNTTDTSKSNNPLHFRFHNPFSQKKVSKSLSVPSSPVEKTGFMYRSSQRIKSKLSKFSKSNMIKSLSHISLLPKKKTETPQISLSQPGSAADVTFKVPSHETVLGSPFMSYADLMTLDKDNSSVSTPPRKSEDFGYSKVTMYIGSEPASRASVSGPSSPYYKDEPYYDQKYIDKSAIKPIGLVHTAMETMLIDKVNSLLAPTSPAPSQSRDNKFEDHLKKKLIEIENERKNIDEQLVKEQGNVQRITRTESKMNFTDSNQNAELEQREDPLIDTAMKTILMDKLQLMVPMSTESQPQIHESDNEKRETLEKLHSDHHSHSGFLHTAKGKVQSLLTPLSMPFIHSNEHKGHESLVHTAMETILLEKVQSMLTPTSPGKNNIDQESLFKTAVKDSGDSVISGHCKYDLSKEENATKKDQENLIQTAMQTILIDKVQSMLPPSSEVVIMNPETPLHTSSKNINKIEREKSLPKDNENDNLVQTAMQTILFEKVQSLLPPTSQPTPGESENNMSRGHLDTERSEEVKEQLSKHKEQEGLILNAMQTILLEKAQSLLPPSSEIKTDFGLTAGNTIKTTSDEINQLLSLEKEPETLIQAAMKTILLDKVQSLLPSSDNKEKEFEKNMDVSPKDLNLAENHSSEIAKKELGNAKVIESEENASLLKSAMKAFLLDKIETIIVSPSPGTKNDQPENTLLNTDIIETSSKGTIAECDSHKMSKLDSNNDPPCKVTKSVSNLQAPPPHRESIALPSGLLEGKGGESTVHSQSECSSSRCDSEANSASVCNNSHAACNIDRNEKEKDKEKWEKEKGSPRHARHESYGGREPVMSLQHVANTSLNSTSAPLGIHRRSSDSDLSVTPKGGSLTTSTTGSGGGAILRPSMNSNNLDMLEYPFLTMTEYPSGFIVHIGGTVCARSVKLVDAGGESAARAAWWAELRTELRAHTRALRCNSVIAYTESAAICEDVCVLSASGTAAVINLDCDFSGEIEAVVNGSKSAMDDSETQPETCTIAHVPYTPGSGPYRAELSTCGCCRRARVPAVLLATCAKPPRLASFSKAITLTAVATRIRRAPPASEPGARDISDQLPFLEYELHKLLLAKLRMQGANALFSLHTQIAVGERCVMALASGTAVRVTALPPPTPPKIKASEHDKDALEIQKCLWEAFSANKAANGYDAVVESAAVSPVPDNNANALPEPPEGEEPPVLDLCADKDACVLELDEAEDVETAKTLSVRRSHMQVYPSCQKSIPAAPPHAFAQVWRAKLVLSGQGGGASVAAEKHVARALDGVTYKLRRLQPCALVTPRFQLELPEDEIQLVVSGAAVPLVDPTKPEHAKYLLSSHSDSNGSNDHSYLEDSQGADDENQGNGNQEEPDDDIFTLDEEQLVKPQTSEVIDEKNVILNGQTPTTVSLTSLSHLAGSRIMRRVCSLRLLFVRETTAVRELGGLSGFLHTFTCEVMAIVRAYTAALGGNALTSFYITQLMLQDNAHKNQGQCLLSVGGDVVNITY